MKKLQSSWKIRPARMKDLPQILDLYAKAREFMREMGNPHQWRDNYPSGSLIGQDIQSGKSYVCCDREEIIGVFYFSAREADPDYESLAEGAWMDEDPYGVIHRIAVSSKQRGVAAFCVRWCLKRCSNIRIDTHEDNIPMRKFLRKMGFVYCGKLRLEDGSLRRAYQKTD